MYEMKNSVSAVKESTTLAFNKSVANLLEEVDRHISSRLLRNATGDYSSKVKVSLCHYDDVVRRRARKILCDHGFDVETTGNDSIVIHLVR